MTLAQETQHIPVSPQTQFTAASEPSQEDQGDSRHLLRVCSLSARETAHKLSGAQGALTTSCNTGSTAEYHCARTAAPAP